MSKTVVNLSVIVGDQVEQATFVVDTAALASQNWTAAVLQLALNAATTPPPPDEQGGEWAKSGNTHAIYRTDSGAVGGVP